MTNHNLTENGLRALRCVAGMMIPASARHGVPGADDDTIFDNIVNSMERDAPLVEQALWQLDALGGGVFYQLDLVRREAAVAALRDAGGATLTALTRVIVQCYYRDDRVMRSLGMEPRPPFPKGFEVEQGDWSLLDPVRARAAFYRRTD